MLTKIMEAQDETDHEIMAHTINMVSSLKLGNFLLDDDSNQKYYEHVIDLTQSLLKANSHRRKYLAIEKRLLKSYEEECLKNVGKSDLGMKPVELNTEIEGFLSQIKSALDSLAKSFKFTLGVSLHGWHKNGPDSGGVIIKALENNIPEPKKEKISMLLNYIRENIPWISYVVKLRDEGQHEGGIKNVTDIVFVVVSKSVLPQRIAHGPSDIEEVSDFLTRLMHDITMFVNGCLVGSILFIAPPAMGIKRYDDKPGRPYSWVLFRNKNEDG